MSRSVEPWGVTTGDGWALRGDVLRPESTPSCAVVLAHAMMVTRRSMDRPAGAGLGSTLVARGFAVLNADLRGHGESRPGADEGGSFDYDAFVRQDLPALVRSARAKFPGLPVVVVGHSLGGHAAAIAAGVEPAAAPDGLVALAANLWAPHLEPSRARRLVKRSVFAGWLALARRKGHFDPRPLRLGNAPEPLAYIEHFVQMFEHDHLASPDGRVDYEAALARASIPILSVSSRGDRLLGHPACVRAFFDLCTSAEVTHREVVDFDYGARAPSHMGLVTDPRSAPLWHEIGTWIASLASRLAVSSVA